VRGLVETNESALTNSSPSTPNDELALAGVVLLLALTAVGVAMTLAAIVCVRRHRRHLGGGPPSPALRAPANEVTEASEAAGFLVAGLTTPTLSSPSGGSSSAAVASGNDPQRPRLTNNPLEDVYLQQQYQQQQMMMMPFFPPPAASSPSSSLRMERRAVLAAMSSSTGDRSANAPSPIDRESMV